MGANREGLFALALASSVAIGAGVAQAAQIVVHSVNGFAGDTLQGIETDDFSVALNDAGDFLFIGIGQGGSSEALYKGNLHDPAAATRVVKVGEAYDQKFITYLDQDGVRLNQAGDFTFIAGIRTRSLPYADALFKNDRAILLPDDHIDGYDINYVDEEGNDIDDAGRVVHFAEIQDPDPDDTNFQNDAIFFQGKVLVKEGQTIAGQPIVDLPQNNELRLNNSGQIAFTGVIKEAVRDENFQLVSPREYALFRTTVTGGTTTHAVVAKTGDLVPGLGLIENIREDYIDQNELGHIAFAASFDNYAKTAILVDEGDGSGPEVRFAPGMALSDGSLIQRVDSSDGVLINDRGDIVFIGRYVDDSESGRRALFNQDGVLLVGTQYDDEGNPIGRGTQIGDYYVHYFSGEAWALNELGQLLVGVTLVDVAGNYSTAMVLIPEPATAGLVLGAAALALGRRSRRGR